MSNLRETRRLKVALTDDEVAARSRAMAHALVVLKGLELALREFQADMKNAVKARQDAIRDRRSEVDAYGWQVSERCEERHVPCEWRLDMDAGKKYLIRLDTEVAIEWRPVTQDERQLAIGQKLEEANQEQVALWERQLAGATTPDDDDEEPAEDGGEEDDDDQF